MKIIVIGEICVDKFIYSEIKRLSPEAPVPVLTPIRETTNSGMAGNVVANIQALYPKAEVFHVMQEKNITKTRYVEEKSNHMFIRVDEGEDNMEMLRWEPYLDKFLAEADAVIVSDYNKGFLSNLHLAEIARKSKISILDSKRQLTDDIIKDFTFVKLNESEHENNPDLTLDNIITTLGKKGAKYKDVLLESPNPQDTIDVSGAGDTFVAAFTLHYLLYGKELDAIKFANNKSAEVVTKRGVAVPSEIS